MITHTDHVYLGGPGDGGSAAPEEDSRFKQGNVSQKVSPNAVVDGGDDYSED